MPKVEGMPETPLEISRVWVEFDDPAEPNQRFRCDLTWFTSNWACIYGSGCKGIYADRPDDGCCTLGAHFTDKDDLARVEAIAAKMSPEEWQRHVDVGRAKAWTARDGKETTTKVVDGACIFLNDPDFPGGAGCALHIHAVRRGIAPHDAKPDVCWQLPIRRSYRTVTLPDETSYLEITLTEYDRRGWGPGGHDLDWYCTGAPEAHVGREPLYRSAHAELIEMMGPLAYAELVHRCEAHLLSVRALRARGARTLLPLMVHPATLAAPKPRPLRSLARARKR